MSTVEEHQEQEEEEQEEEQDVEDTDTQDQDEDVTIPVYIQGKDGTRQYALWSTLSACLVGKKPGLGFLLTAPDQVPLPGNQVVTVTKLMTMVGLEPYHWTTQVKLAKTWLTIEEGSAVNKLLKHLGRLENKRMKATRAQIAAYLTSLPDDNVPVYSHAGITPVYAIWTTLIQVLHGDIPGKGFRATDKNFKPNVGGALVTCNKLLGKAGAWKCQFKLGKTAPHLPDNFSVHAFLIHLAQYLGAQLPTVNSMADLRRVFETPGNLPEGAPAEDQEATTQPPPSLRPMSSRRVKRTTVPPHLEALARAQVPLPLLGHLSPGGTSRSPAAQPVSSAAARQSDAAPEPESDDEVEAEDEGEAMGVEEGEGEEEGGPGGSGGEGEEPSDTLALPKAVAASALEPTPAVSQAQEHAAADVVLVADQQQPSRRSQRKIVQAQVKQAAEEQAQIEQDVRMQAAVREKVLEEARKTAMQRIAADKAAAQDAQGGGQGGAQQEQGKVEDKPQVVTAPTKKSTSKAATQPKAGAGSSQPHAAPAAAQPAAQPKVQGGPKSKAGPEQLQAAAAAVAAARLAAQAKLQAKEQVKAKSSPSAAPAAAQPAAVPAQVKANASPSAAPAAAQPAAPAQAAAGPKPASQPKPNMRPQPARKAVVLYPAPGQAVVPRPAEPAAKTPVPVLVSAVASADQSAGAATSVVDLVSPDTGAAATAEPRRLTRRALLVQQQVQSPQTGAPPAGAATLPAAGDDVPVELQAGMSQHKPKPQPKVQATQKQAGAQPKAAPAAPKATSQSQQKAASQPKAQEQAKPKGQQKGPASQPPAASQPKSHVEAPPELQSQLAASQPPFLPQRRNQRKPQYPSQPKPAPQPSVQEAAAQQPPAPPQEAAADDPQQLPPELQPTRRSLRRSLQQTPDAHAEFVELRPQGGGRPGARAWLTMVTMEQPAGPPAVAAPGQGQQPGTAGDPSMTTAADPAAGPAGVKPAPTAPSAPKQPASKQPAAKQPASTQPASTQPATTKPGAKQPAAKQPSTSKPAAKQPAATQPASKQPAATKPAPAQPATTKPAAKQPAASKVATTQPTATRPPSTRLAAQQAAPPPGPTPDDADAIPLDLCQMMERRPPPPPPQVAQPPQLHKAQPGRTHGVELSRQTAVRDVVRQLVDKAAAATQDKGGAVGGDKPGVVGGDRPGVGPAKRRLEADEGVLAAAKRVGGVDRGVGGVDKGVGRVSNPAAVLPVQESGGLVRDGAGSNVNKRAYAEFLWMSDQGADKGRGDGDQGAVGGAVTKARRVEASNGGPIGGSKVVAGADRHRFGVYEEEEEQEDSWGVGGLASRQMGMGKVDVVGRVGRRDSVRRVEPDVSLEEAAAQALQGLSGLQSAGVATAPAHHPTHHAKRARKEPEHHQQRQQQDDEDDEDEDDTDEGGPGWGVLPSLGRHAHLGQAQGLGGAPLLGAVYLLPSQGGWAGQAGQVLPIAIPAPAAYPANKRAKQDARQHQLMSVLDDDDDLDVVGMLRDSGVPGGQPRVPRRAEVDLSDAPVVPQLEFGISEEGQTVLKNEPDVLGALMALLRVLGHSRVRMQLAQRYRDEYSVDNKGLRSLSLHCDALRAAVASGLVSRVLEVFRDQFGLGV